MLGNGDVFFPSAGGRYQRRKAILLSWAGRIFLRGCCMVEREFAETVDTVEEDGIVESKIVGRFCVAIGGVTFGGRGGTK